LVAGDSCFVLTTTVASVQAPEPVAALWKDEMLPRVAVAELSAAAVGDVLATALGSTVDPITVADLACRCQGNMLFLRALVLGALDDGSLRDVEGSWRLVRPVAPSGRLVELVEAQLAGATADERSVLELLAVGEPLGPAEVDALSHRSTVEALEQRGLVTSQRDGLRLQIRTAHPLYGDVLRAEMSPLRRASIARSLAEVVERCGARRREDALRIAVWQLEGGPANPRLMLDAARTSYSRHDYALAERLGRAASAAGAGFDAALLAAETTLLQGRTDESEAEFAVLAERAADDEQRARVAADQIQHLGFAVGRKEEAIRIADRALSTISEPGWRQEVSALRAGLLASTEGPAATISVAAPLLHTARGPALATACLFAAWSLVRLGRFEEALEASRLGYAEHAGLAAPLAWHPRTQYLYHCDALGYQGHLMEAEELAISQYEAGLAERSVDAQALFAMQRGRFTGERGRVHTATRLLREAVGLYRQLGRVQWVRGCLAHLGVALALSGNAAGARAALTAPDAPTFDTPLFNTGMELYFAWAWTAVSEGDLPSARRMLWDAVEHAGSRSDLVGECSALHTLARLGGARRVVDRLLELAGVIEGDLARARAAHAVALATSDPKKLEAVSADFESLGADLLAAEASADACVLWKKRGVLRREAAAGRRAQLLAATCENPSTPALRAAQTRPVLTRAEQDAATLAAAGRSNREIAQKFSLSVRTVENQLQRVYGKLGISSRGELAAALRIVSAPEPERLDAWESH
jgi:DNA-binding CsgD family transcriptional regulator